MRQDSNSLFSVRFRDSRESEIVKSSIRRFYTGVFMRRSRKTPRCGEMASATRFQARLIFDLRRKAVMVGGAGGKDRYNIRTQNNGVMS